jgi:hypothetical protein
MRVFFRRITIILGGRRSGQNTLLFQSSRLFLFIHLSRRFRFDLIFGGGGVNGVLNWPALIKKKVIEWNGALSPRQ